MSVRGRVVKEDRKSDGESDKKEQTNPAPIVKKDSYRGYREGTFRSVRSAPAYEDEPMKVVEKKDQTHPAFGARLESENARLYLGKDEGKHVLVTAFKPDTEETTNRHRRQRIHISRSYAYFRRNYETYTEEMDHSFLHELEKDASIKGFLRYLERAIGEERTQPIAEVFPFLDGRRDQNRLADLDRLKDQIRATETDEETKKQLVAGVDQQMSALRQKIYDDRYKRAQFTKRLTDVLEEEREVEDPDDFWLWEWIKKIRQWLIDEKEDEDETT